MLKEEQIKLIAGSLLPGFIPKDDAETELSFHFTVPPKSYKVWYAKNNQSNWDFKKFEEVKI